MIWILWRISGVTDCMTTFLIKGKDSNAHILKRGNIIGIMTMCLQNGEAMWKERHSIDGFRLAQKMNY